MTFNELYDKLTKLKKENPDCGNWKIILQGDAEGNYYSPMVGIEEAKCLEDKRHGCEVVHPEDVDSYDEEELKDVFVIWPV